MRLVTLRRRTIVLRFSTRPGLRLNFVIITDTVSHDYLYGSCVDKIEFPFRL